jgi:thiamine biosynthesis protein ThiS
VACLVQQLGLEPRYLAVERNRELVPRRDHERCALVEGDQLEIVTLVGGG